MKTRLELTPQERYDIVSYRIENAQKTLDEIENLVALMRGLEHGYCYIGRQDVARIIRELADDNELGRSLSVRLGKGWRTMSDLELYEKGRWNYKRTPLVDLLYNLHCNPWMFLNID